MGQIQLTKNHVEIWHTAYGSFLESNTVRHPRLQCGTSKLGAILDAVFSSILHVVFTYVNWICPYLNHCPYFAPSTLYITWGRSSILASLSKVPLGSGRYLNIFSPSNCLNHVGPPSRLHCSRSPSSTTPGSFHSGFSSPFTREALSLCHRRRPHLTNGDALNQPWVGGSGSSLKHKLASALLPLNLTKPTTVYRVVAELLPQMSIKARSMRCLVTMYTYIVIILLRVQTYS